MGYPVFESPFTNLTHNDPGNFSLDLLLSSIDFTNTGVTGKAVVRPVLINHTWIYFPNSLLPNHVRFDIPAERNVLFHLKENNQDLASTGRIFSREPSYLKYYGGGTKPLLSRGDIDAIQGDFLRMKSRPEIAKIMKSLPQKPFYPPLMAECTRRTFSQYDAARRYDLMKCPSPDRCRLPERPGVPCVNARAEYLSSPTGTVINVHHVKTSYFTVEDGCSP